MHAIEMLAPRRALWAVESFCPGDRGPVVSSAIASDGRLWPIYATNSAVGLVAVMVVTGSLEIVINLDSGFGYGIGALLLLLGYLCLARYASRHGRVAVIYRESVVLCPYLSLRQLTPADFAVEELVPGSVSVQGSMLVMQRKRWRFRSGRLARGH